MDITEIQTVKQAGNGYIVNDTMWVPDAPGNRDYRVVAEWIAAGNTPDPADPEPVPPPNPVMDIVLVLLESPVALPPQASELDPR